MGEKPSIVIIDDNEQKRRTYAEKFRSEGFEVFEAANGKIGLELILAHTPDLIFTGIDMPEMDGFTLIELLKKDPKFASIPIMISSHLNREADEERAKKLGVTDFIYYGFVTLTEVVKRARALIEQSKKSI